MEDSRRRGLPPPRLVSGWASLPWYLRYTRDPLGALLDGQKRFGNVFAFSRPSLRQRVHKHIFAIGPEFNRQVLSRPDAFRTCPMSPRAPAGSAMDRLRSGFQPANGAGTQLLRRMTQAPFTKQAVQGYHAEIISVAEQTLGEWPLLTKIDLAEHLRSLSLALSNRLLFGAESSARLARLGELFDQFVRGAYFSPAVLFPFHFPGSPYSRLTRTCNQLAAVLDAMIDQRKSQPAGERDILQMLVNQQTPGAEIDLFGPAVFLLIASFETLATALTWTLFLLAQHPQTAADLGDELQARLGGESPTAAQLEQLPLLGHVIQESLRLFPPIPIVFRRSMGVDHEIGGLPVGWGDWVFCSQYATHRLPNLYDQPQKFLPQRWETIHPGAYDYFPWGAGPRSCVGFSLGMTTLKILLAVMLQKFRFAVVPGSKIDRVVKVTLNPRQGLPMILHPSDGRYEAVAVRGQICEMVDLPDPHPLAKVAGPSRRLSQRMAA